MTIQKTECWQTLGRTFNTYVEAENFQKIIMKEWLEEMCLLGFLERIKETTDMDDHDTPDYEGIFIEMMQYHFDMEFFTINQNNTISRGIKL